MSKLTHLDLRYARCPEPLLQSKLWLGQASVGHALHLLVSDSGSLKDVPHYFQAKGHRVVVTTQINAWLIQITHT